jgi:hypothetical protein
MELNDKYSQKEYEEFKRKLGDTADIAERLADYMEKNMLHDHKVENVKEFFKQAYNEAYPRKPEKKDIVISKQREHGDHVINGALHLLRMYWKYGFLMQRVNSSALFH